MNFFKFVKQDLAKKLQFYSKYRWYFFGLFWIILIGVIALMPKWPTATLQVTGTKNYGIVLNQVKLVPGEPEPVSPDLIFEKIGVAHLMLDSSKHEGRLWVDTLLVCVIHYTYIPSWTNVGTRVNRTYKLSLSSAHLKQVKGGVLEIGYYLPSTGKIRFKRPGGGVIDQR